ncbi:MULTISPECIES: hypothetical protein [Chryseobacterium]|uniref:DUF6438 domain-containing protein n=1 Tax=Chryseobacterium geocarposphaerae TaxID=1416776 RepID=A0ABU1LE26_9FLAO|nr:MULTISPECIES: hypothetical protein [Chryseobacterium]MDR6404977.1 hypothetical protein [Chryseobacterium geocarposphaerae]MDR6697760.1 hypothetical protein [Chryseobacterium ginsenosidimutans]
MGKALFFVLFLCFLSTLYSQKLNKIDSLLSTNDVKNFIKNENNKSNYELNIDDKIDYDWYCNVIADSLKLKQNWGKADFDNNGLTDLLVTGNTTEGPRTIYILDKGNYFESKTLSKGKLYEQCSFSTVKGNKIEYQSVKILDRYGSLSKLTKENLVYKYGDFIEENGNPKRHNILEIELEATGSYWNRSSTKIKIVSNKDITWIIDEDYNTKVSSSKLSNEEFKGIIDLLHYIDFENLEEEYNVSYSDAGTTSLKITYDNLKVKNISDYGGMGTRGLTKLYDILLQLKQNQ